MSIIVAVFFLAIALSIIMWMRMTLCLVREESQLNAAIVYDRDFGIKTLTKSHLLKINYKIHERPQHMLMRVSLGIHHEDLYCPVSVKWFTHAFQRGHATAQSSSCFLLAIKGDRSRNHFRYVQAASAWRSTSRARTARRTALCRCCACATRRATWTSARATSSSDCEFPSFPDLFVKRMERDAMWSHVLSNAAKVHLYIKL